MQKNLEPAADTISCSRWRNGRGYSESYLWCSTSIFQVNSWWNCANWGASIRCRSLDRYQDAHWDFQVRFQHFHIRGGSADASSDTSHGKLPTDSNPTRGRMSTKKSSLLKQRYIAQMQQSNQLWMLSILWECEFLPPESTLRWMLTIKPSSAYELNLPFTDLLNGAMVLPIFDGGNIGIRKRALQKLFMSKDYKPWATCYDWEY